ncbi:MAG: hypothetical protein LBR29_11005 [Methylobacteriaceae bacterium]|jgi:hypothetical protein|nr:hypothetical protein [Methylobacteriaceae bacterium]
MTEHITIRKSPLSTTGFIVITLFLCLVLTWVRVHDARSAADLLYKDDSIVFLTAANYGGFLSLLAAYAGYQHLVIRIGMLIVSLFDLSIQPLVVLGYTVLLHCVFWTLVAVTLLSLDVSKPVVLLVCVLLVIQPTHQEVMLNVTNSQWLTGTALITFVLGYQGRVALPVAVSVGLLLGLQGPFSILLVPVLAAQRLLTKDRRNMELVFCVGLAALLQSLSLMMNTRELVSFEVVNDEVIATNTRITFMLSWIPAILKALGEGFVYNVKDPLGVAFMAVSLPLALIGGLRTFRFGLGEPERRNAGVFLALTTAALVVGLSVIGTYSKINKEDFEGSLLCLTQYDRYLFVPHSLLIIALPVLLYRRPRLTGLVMAGFAYVSVVNYAFADRPPTYFASYVNMGRFMETDVVLNPAGYDDSGNRLGAFPWNAWIYPIRRNAYEPLSESRVVPLTPLEPDNASVIRLTTDVVCPDTSDIAVKVNVSSPTPIKVDMKLANSRRAYLTHRLYDNVISTLFVYNGESNLRPEGDILLDFAFPYPGDGTRLEFSLQPYQQGEGDAGEAVVKGLSVRKMTLYCLPQPSEPNR